MAARIAITVDDAEVQAALGEAARRASDLTGLMDVIGAALVSSAQGRFENAAGPDGLPWRPSLRAMTQRGRTLLDSGRLRQSLSHRPSRAQVEVGTNVLYAGVHQFGAARRRCRPGPSAPRRRARAAPRTAAPCRARPWHGEAEEARRRLPGQLAQQQYGQPADHRPILRALRGG